MRMLPVQAPFASLFVAGAAWGLAMLFTKRRHTALASLLLAFAFVGGVATFLLLLLGGSGGMGMGGAQLIAFLSFAVGAGAAFLHWKVFRVPIAIALAACSALIALVAVTMSGMSGPETLMIILLIAGLGIFMWAMWWDSKDPLRYTEKSEVAFWLHWLAGGLIVTALATLFGVSQSVDSIGGAIAILLIYALVVLVALAVNRKVYLIAGLQPFISAIQNLVGGSRPRYPTYEYGGPGAVPYGSPYGPTPYGNPYGPYPPRPYYGSYNSTETQMITLLIIAVLLVLLAIYWAPVRRKVVGMLPEGLRTRLPATGTEPKEQADAFD